ncbi:uncharacterized protein A4U43_C06F4740 [Asparagus officinalis]|uniref:ATPase AAA-type core domain-containing protein n=1 Tax=Asparagus officinalis TaxID=4686 RepID=A0A5P1EMY1_ASPOF|nr:uncharacterized protein A4U43_C06F4740 [Asparagus officinalis]
MAVDVDSYQQKNSFEVLSHKHEDLGGEEQIPEKVEVMALAADCCEQENSSEDFTHKIDDLSSLIVAIANFLNYDVFDLELTRVATNSDLRSLLVQTTDRSVIVIEDIDCSLQITGDRQNHNGDDSDDDESNNNGRVTLSGLLNFTDGLWSCCGEQRIIVFTTNYKDGVDEALLRAGRMDVHLRLGECGVHVMREMVERYVGVAEEVKEMADVAESCVRAGAAMTPAEVGEVLMRSREDPLTAVSGGAAGEDWRWRRDKTRRGTSCGEDLVAAVAPALPLDVDLSSGEGFDVVSVAFGQDSINSSRYEVGHIGEKGGEDLKDK